MYMCAPTYVFRTQSIIINPESAELFLWKPWRPKGLFSIRNNHKCLKCNGQFFHKRTYVDVNPSVDGLDLTMKGTIIVMFDCCYIPLGTYFKLCACQMSLYLCFWHSRLR